MKLEFLNRPASEQTLFLQETAALARHPVRERALTRVDLRRRAAAWKSRFFGASWARYDLATRRQFPSRATWLPPDRTGKGLSRKQKLKPRNSRNFTQGQAIPDFT